MPDHTASRQPSPEERLDWWLDALNEPGRLMPPAPPGEIGELAAVAQEYRRVLGATSPTATDRAVKHERNGAMSHPTPLASPNGTWTKIERRQEPTGWMDRISQGFATAMVLALLIAMVGGTYLREFGLPAGGDPRQAPGLAASPEATPESTLACGAPGYRPVLQGEIEADMLAGIDLGTAPIVIGENEITTTMPGGEALLIPRETNVNVDSHAIVTEREDGPTTVTRLSDGESWELPSVHETLLGNGRYYLTPAVASTTDWIILDVLTGEQVTTSDILGQPFGLPQVPRNHSRVRSEDRSVLVLDFNQSALGDPDDAPTGEQPGVLVIPGSLSDAYFKILSPQTMVSPDGSLLISYDDLYDTSTGELVRSDAFEGTPIDFTEDSATLLTLDLMEDRILSNELVTGAGETLYAPDTDIQMVGYDRSEHTMVIGVLNDDNSNEWTWVDLDSGERVPLPELSGYGLMRASPREPARTVEQVAQFTQASNESPWTVRGLDMATGRVSGTIEHHMSEDEQWINQVPYLEMGAHLIAMDDTGDITLVTPETGQRVELSLPSGIEPFPVQPWYLTVSPNDACIALSLYDQDSSESFIAPIAEGATWTEIDVRGIRWVETDVEPTDTQTLPAQDFATPLATPPVNNGLSCASPGYVPVVLGDVDPDALASLGLTGNPVVIDEDEITVPFGDGGETTLPANSRPLGDIPGVLISHGEDRSLSVTNIALGERWQFPALDYSGVLVGDAGPPSFAFAGPFVVAPTDSTGVDYTILDTRTGDSVLVSDLLGGTFSWMVSARATSDDPQSGSAIEFTRLTTGLSEAAIIEEQLAEDESAMTDRSIGDVTAVVLPGSVGDASLIDLGGLPAAFAFSNDGERVAWRARIDDGEREGYYAIFVAQANDLDVREIVTETDPPLEFAPIAFSPDGSTLFVKSDNAIQAYSLDGGGVTDIFTATSRSPEILTINTGAGTVIFRANGEEIGEAWLLDTSTAEISRLPELDGYVSFTPLLDEPDLSMGGRYTLGTLGSGEGSTREHIVVNTATGDVIARHEEPTVGGDASWSFSRVAVADRFASMFDQDGTIRVVNLENGDSWNLAMPDLGVDLTDPGYFVRLEMSPAGTCMTLSLYQETGREGNNVASTSITEHIGSWVAAVEPDGEWTEIDTDIVDWWPVPDAATSESLPVKVTPAPNATSEAEAIADGGLSCASPGYVPVVAGEVDADDLAMIGFDGEAIASTDDGVTVPLPDGTNRILPPGSVIYPDSDLALAIHEDNSATVTRIPDGESWSFGAVEPRIAGENQDFFSNGRYVIGPTDDSRTDWLILDTLTGERRTTADILGEPFAGPLDLWTQVSSENDDLWLLQFLTLTFPDYDETPPADGVAPPGYLVIPGSLDDAWFSDGPGRAEPIEIVVSPEGTSYIVNQVVRDAKTGERVDTGDHNLTYFGVLIAYLDESTLLTFSDSRLQTIDIATGTPTTIHTSLGRIQNATLDADAGMVVISSGTRGPIRWELIDLTTGEVTPLPDLVDYQLASTSMTGRITRAGEAVAFIQPGATGEIQVRALDMRTGALSDPVTTRTAARGAEFPGSPASTDGRFVETSNVDGDLLLIDSASGAAIELPLPDGVSQSGGGRLSITVSPSQQCAVLSVYDEQGEPIGNSWVASTEPGASWTSLDYHIERWVEIEEVTTDRTLPSEAASPPATPSRPGS